MQLDCPTFICRSIPCSAYNRFFSRWIAGEGSNAGHLQLQALADCSIPQMQFLTVIVCESQTDATFIVCLLNRCSRALYTTTFVRYAVGLRCKEDVLTFALSIVISRSKMYSHLNTVCCARNTNRCCTVSWTVFFTHNNIRIHCKDNSQIRSVASVADKC